MTSADRNDLMPAQGEKLEWVTPKISLIDAGDALGVNKFTNPPTEGTRLPNFIVGPS